MYYIRIDNPLSELSCKKLLAIAETRLGEPYLLQNKGIPSDISFSLNTDLKSEITGLEVEQILFFSNSYTVPFHVDLMNPDQVYNASLVIPLIMNPGIEIQWQGGKYNLNLAVTEDNVRYFTIDWAESPKIVESTKLDGTMLCSTNVPHGVLSTTNNWLIATIRFTQNFDLEELKDKLVKVGYDKSI
jgi:hypothetical protein